jgi:hypothetical protein
MAVIIKPKVPLAGSVEQKKDPSSVDQKLAKKPKKPKYQGMAAVALLMSAPGQKISDPKCQEMLALGPLDLYANINAKNPLDSVLAMLLTAVTSASLDSFAQAANLPSGQAKLRDLNLQLAFKGCRVAADLVKTLDNRGRQKFDKVTAGEKVTVGKVNVEAGGQAIVGNVESTTPSGGSPTKHPKIN